MNAASRIAAALIQVQPVLSTPISAEMSASIRPVLAWRLDSETGRPVAVWVAHSAPRWRPGHS
jgi:hypothetical protein